MGSLAGVLVGMSDAHRQQGLMDLQQRIASQQSLIDAFDKIAQRDDIDPRVRNSVLQKSVEMRGWDVSKIKPKDLEAMSATLGQAIAAINQQPRFRMPNVADPGIFPNQQFQPPPGSQNQVAAPTPPPSEQSVYEGTGFIDPLKTATDTARAKMGIEQEGVAQQEQSLIQAGFDPQTAAMIARGIRPAMSSDQAVTNIPGKVKGDKVSFKTDMYGKPIDPKSDYIQRVQGRSIVGVIPVNSEVFQIGFQPDPDPASKTGWMKTIVDRSNGQIIDTVKNVLAPTGMYPTTTQGEATVTVEGPSGSEVRRIPTSSTTTRQLPGERPPSPPPGRTVGPAPLGEMERRNIPNARSGLTQVQNIRKWIAEDKKVLLKAAIPGSPGARRFETARKELSDIITRLRTGAALNMQEEDFYKGQMPGALDLLLDPSAIDYKLNLFEQLFESIANRGHAPAASERMEIQTLPDGSTWKKEGGNWVEIPKRGG